MDYELLEPNDLIALLLQKDEQIKKLETNISYKELEIFNLRERPEIMKHARMG